MKGNDKVIDTLNALLADELTAISQYIVHAEMCANWGYGVLHEAVEERAKVEMKHAEMHIERILFLEGIPIVSKLNPMHIGPDVAAQLQNDWKAEDTAVKAYNAGIALCTANGDHGSRTMLDSIVKDEEAHIDWIEAQLDQIQQMGLQNYLAQQIS